MLESVVQIVRSELVPGSPMVLLVGATCAAVLLYGSARAQRAGRWILTLAVLGYWTLSTTAAATLLEWGLDRGYGQLGSAQRPGELQAVVVLGGGSETFEAAGRRLNLVSPQSAWSALEAARLYHLLDDPLVIASGGRPRPTRQLEPESAALADALVTLGVPRHRIVLESQSHDTHDQAVELRTLLALRGIERFVLVTAPSHMWRTMLLFESQGMKPVPSVSSMQTRLPRAAAPSRLALQASEQASYHYLALAYAWSRGWLSDADLRDEGE